MNPSQLRHIPSETPAELLQQWVKMMEIDNVFVSKLDVSVHGSIRKATLTVHVEWPVECERCGAETDKRHNFTNLNGEIVPCVE